MGVWTRVRFVEEGQVCCRGSVHAWSFQRMYIQKFTSFLQTLFYIVSKHNYLVYNSLCVWKVCFFLHYHNFPIYLVINNNWNVNLTHLLIHPSCSCSHFYFLLGSFWFSWQKTENLDLMSLLQFFFFDILLQGASMTVAIFNLFSTSVFASFIICGIQLMLNEYLLDLGISNQIWQV